MGKKIANDMTDKGHMIWLQMSWMTRFKCYDISHNIQTDHTTQQQKIVKKSIQKWAEYLNRYFSKK